MKKINFTLILICILIISSCGMKGKKYSRDTFENDIESFSEDEITLIRIGLLAFAIQNKFEDEGITYGELLEKGEGIRRKNNNEFSNSQEGIGSQLTLVDVKAGLYVNYYPLKPIAILKFKNVSDVDYVGNVNLKVIFIKDDIVVCENTAYLSGPIPSGTIKQAAIKCFDYKVFESNGNPNLHFTAKIYLNNELYQTINFTGATKEWIKTERDIE